MNRPVHFEIHVDDFDRAKKFYSDVFGWTFELAVVGMCFPDVVAGKNPIVRPAYEIAGVVIS